MNQQLEKIEEGENWKQFRIKILDEVDQKLTEHFAKCGDVELAVEWKSLAEKLRKSEFSSTKQSDGGGKMTKKRQPSKSAPYKK
ncbi:unnamed protein product [Caenorhabditis angaria]|uniref:Uncharacterized protein n=1 Tax=Caenorhabditis angaria TaxID=860376 RepID=A0A9P1MW90_9PELO|nr:unnamed protein product [Caenorhabditis angaria]